MDFVATGLDAGIRADYGYGWARAGVVRHRLTASWSADGPRSERAPANIGYEAAAGVAIPLTAAISLAPGVRLTACSARFPGDDEADRVHSLTRDIGVRYRIR